MMNTRKCTKCACLLLSFALVLALFGCGNAPATTAHKHTLPAATTVPGTKNDDYTTFTTEHYQITLPKAFEQTVTDDGTIAFYNGYAIIVPRNEPFTVHPSLPDMTLKAYGQQMIGVIGVDTTLKSFGGVLWFEYEVAVPDSNQVLTHLVTLYKSNSAFWYIEYICDSREIERHRNYYLEWSLSVTFTD